MPDGEVLAFLQALVDEDKIPMKEQNVCNARGEEGEYIAGPLGDRIGRRISEKFEPLTRLDS